MWCWQRSWIIVQIDFRRTTSLYIFLGALYWLGMMATEWWAPGTWAPLDLWHPETWLQTLWKGAR